MFRNESLCIVIFIGMFSVNEKRCVTDQMFVKYLSKLLWLYRRFPCRRGGHRDYPRDQHYPAPQLLSAIPAVSSICLPTFITSLRDPAPTSSVILYRFLSQKAIKKLLLARQIQPHFVQSLESLNNLPHARSLVINRSYLPKSNQNMTNKSKQFCPYPLDTYSPAQYWYNASHPPPPPITWPSETQPAFTPIQVS